MDVYKVGVVLSLKNGISAGLRIIQGDLGDFMRSVDRVNNSVGKLSTNLFKIAGASAAMGVGVLAVYEEIIKKGDLMQQQVAKMQAAGISAQQIALNQKAAWAAANGGVFDVSPQEAMGTITILRSLLGSSEEARKALIPVLKTEVGLQGALGAQAANSLILGLKAIDISGGMVSGTHISESKLISLLPYMAQAMIQTHGILTGAQILRMMQQAGPAASAISFKNMLEDTAEAISSLGPAVGRGLFTSYMVASVGRASAVSANYLTRLGLVPKGDMNKVSGSSTYLFNPDDLYGAKYLQQNGFMAWVHDKIIPYLQKKGDNTPQKLMRDLAGIFPASTSARLISWIINNWPQRDRTKNLIDSGVKNGTAYNAYQTTWAGATDNFQKAWSGLMTSLGAPGVNQAASALNHISAYIHKFSAWFSSHPQDTRYIEQGLLGIGAGLLALGVILSGAAIVALLGTGGTIAALIAGIAAVGLVFAAFNWKEITSWFTNAMEGIWKALLDFIHGIAYIATHPLADIKHLGSAIGGVFNGPAPLPPSAYGLKTTGSSFLDSIADAGRQPIAPPVTAFTPPPVPPTPTYNGPIPVHVTNPKDIHNGVAQSFTKQLLGIQTGPTGFDYSSGFTAPAGAY